MPGGLTPTQIAENTIATLNWFARNKVTQTQLYQSYPLYSMFFEGDSAMSDMIRDGKRVTMPIRLRDQAGFRISGLYATEPTQRDDTNGEVTADWFKWSQNSLVFDVDDPKFNRGKSEIFNWQEQTYNGADAEDAARIEELAFHAPTTPTTAGELQGLLYWFAPVTASSTDPIGGFGGSRTYGRVSGSSTTIGGIDRSNPLNIRARNWCATGEGTFGPTDRELAARAMTDTKFMRLPNGTYRAAGNRTASMALLLNSTHYHTYERDVNLGPDDKNGDLRRFNTNLKFRGVPIIIGHVMDAVDVAVSGQNPGNNILGVNTGSIFGFKDETWGQDMKPITNYDAPTVFRVHRRGWGGIIGRDMRTAGFRIHPAF